MSDKPEQPVNRLWNSRLAVSQKEAAKLLGLSVTYFAALKIRRSRVGRIVRYQIRDLQRFLEQNIEADQ